MYLHYKYQTSLGKHKEFHKKYKEFLSKFEINLCKKKTNLQICNKAMYLVYVSFFGLNNMYKSCN